MSDLETLIRLLEVEPYNPVLVAMAVDELMQVKDMNRSEADQHVSRVQQVAHDAAEMSFAGELLARPGKRRLLVSALRRRFGLGRAMGVTVLLVPGRGDPVMTWRQSSRVYRGAWMDALLTVHAGDAIEQMKGAKEFARRQR